MLFELVDNEWFTAEFPASVEITAEPVVDHASTTEFAAELEPFGVFVVRVTQMPVDPFIAVGPRGWVEHFGNGVMKKLASYDAQIVSDELDTPLGGAVRRMTLRVSYEGPCVAFVAVFAQPDGEFGRVLECSAFVDQARDQQAIALRFLNSVQAKWSQPR